MRKSAAFISLTILIFAQGLLSGCTRVDFDSDPLAFLTSGLGGKKESKNTGERIDMLASDVAPFDPKPSGTMGSLGLNLDMYFADELRSDDERMARLERAVSALHRDVKAMAPAVQKLVSLQHEEPMKAAAPVSLMPHSAQGMTGTQRQPQPHNLKPMDIAVPSSEHEELKKHGARDMSPIPAGTVLVSGLRVGEHADKIRLVFDVTGKTPYNIDLDNGENILVIEFPNARWKGPDHEAFPRKSHLLDSYRAGTGGNNNIVVVQLKNPSKILSQTVLPALSGGGKRIVIDLMK